MVFWIEFLYLVFGFLHSVRSQTYCTCRTHLLPNFSPWFLYIVNANLQAVVIRFTLKSKRLHFCEITENIHLSIKLTMEGLMYVYMSEWSFYIADLAFPPTFTKILWTWQDLIMRSNRFDIPNTAFIPSLSLAI